MIHTKNEKDYISSEKFEVDELRKVIFGQSNRLSKIIAIQLLGRKLYREKFNDFKQIFEDEENESRVRYNAAIELGRIGSQKAKKILLKAINLKDRFVRRGVLESLALIGEEEELKAINDIVQKNKDSPYAEIAATRIAYRKGLKGYRIPFPKPEQFVELDPNKVIEKKLVLANQKKVRNCLRDIKESIPNIDFSPRVMNLKIGERDWLILLNKRFVKPQEILQLFRSKSLIGIIAAKYTYAHDKWIPKYYIYTNPVKEKTIIQILVATSKGIVIFAGTSQFANGKLSFSIRTVKHPSAPLLQIEGSLIEETIHFEKALYQSGRLGKNTIIKRIGNDDKNQKDFEDTRTNDKNLKSN